MDLFKKTDSKKLRTNCKVHNVKSILNRTVTNCYSTITFSSRENIMLKNSNKKWLAIVCCSAMSVPVVAADLNISGFGSLKGTHVSLDDKFPVQLSHLPNDGAVSFSSDSLYALQISSSLSDKVSTTVQIVAEGKDEFDLDVQWAFLSYQVDPSLQWKIGRMPIRMFNRSEYEKVGITNDYARLPVSVYRGFDFSTADGIGVTKKLFIKDTVITLSGSYSSWDGQIETNSGGTFDAKMDDLISINFEVDGDWWKIFAGGFNSTWSEDATDFYNYIDSLGSGAATAAGINGASNTDVNKFTSTLSYQGENSWYRYAGYSINVNSFISDFEYVKYGIDNTFLPDAKAWFVSVGYRFGKSVLTVRTEKLDYKLDESIKNSLTHPILQGAATAIHNSFSSLNMEGDAISYRYDYMPNMAFKAEVFKGESPGGDFTAITAGVDFIF